MGNEPDRVLELTGDSLCPECRASNAVPFEVRVEEVALAPRRDGWTAQGTARSVARCQSCGAACEEIAYRVPYELRGLPCPGCRDAVEYQVALRCVAAGADGFSFTAAVTCPRCTRRSFFRQMLSGLGRIRRISVGPARLEIDLGHQRPTE